MSGNSGWIYRFNYLEKKTKRLNSDSSFEIYNLHLRLICFYEKDEDLPETLPFKNYYIDKTDKKPKAIVVNIKIQFQDTQR